MKAQFLLIFFGVYVWSLPEYIECDLTIKVGKNNGGQSIQTVSSVMNAGVIDNMAIIIPSGRVCTGSTISVAFTNNGRATIHANHGVFETGTNLGYALGSSSNPCSGSADMRIALNYRNTLQWTAPNLETTVTFSGATTQGYGQMFLRNSGMNVYVQSCPGSH